MWKSKSWESKSPKLRELPRTGEGSPQGLEEHLHPKRKSGWGGPPTPTVTPHSLEQVVRHLRQRTFLRLP